MIHVPNSGRLRELLTPQAEIRWLPVPGNHRKTAGRLCLVKNGHEWVSIDSQLPNRLVNLGLQTGFFPELGAYGPFQNVFA